MCWNGKNPQKAPQHHSRRKLQPTYRPTNKYIYTHTRQKKIKNVYTKMFCCFCFFFNTPADCNWQLAFLPSNHQGDTKGRFLSPKKIQNITIKCRLIRIHEVFQPEEQISISAFCHFVIEFLSGTLHVSQALCPRESRIVSTRIRNFFFRKNISLRIRKFSRPHAAYSNGLVSDCIRKWTCA